MKENTGILLYCIANKANAELSSIKGLDENYSLYAVEKNGLYGIVSEVNLQEYGEENMQLKSEDVNWLTDKASKFMNIILSVNKNATVIPMKFMTLFNNVERVQGIIEENVSNFNENLTKLIGKEEWSLKIYCNDKVFKETSMEEEIKKFEESLAGKPKGSSFFLRKKFDGQLNDKIQQKICKIANSIVDNASSYYVEVKSNKLLAKELTGFDDRMILNCAFLVDNKQMDDFRHYLDEIIDEYEKRGFTLQITGPWPPYNFCN